MRKSHENPFIQKLYKDFSGKPLGEKSHNLLHIKHISRKKKCSEDKKKEIVLV
ncbi:iron hydrogenase small subunit [Clostridium arbusti]|uniref:iron hydrogenase small subunit n=1 Tax=Clostridium arbusti TaxID=1137848 RepID=UPI0035A2572C